MIEITRTITLRLTEDEFLKLAGGIGQTSHITRTAAGMTVSQSQWFTEFYEKLDEAAKRAGIEI